MGNHTPLLEKKHHDFFDRPSTIKWILRLFYSACILLVLVDFVIHRHIESDIEKIPAFYAIYGFVACVLLVLMAVQMRKLLRRSEHYYDHPQSGSYTQQAPCPQQKSCLNTQNTND